MPEQVSRHVPTFRLRQALQAIHERGTLSIPGVCGGALGKFNFGGAFGAAIHMGMGQTQMQKYLKPLLKTIEDGKMDPTFLISHRMGIEGVPEIYKIWRDKKDQDQISQKLAA